MAHAPVSRAHGREVSVSVLDLMKKRCSVRAFETRPVEEEKLLRMLEAGRVAPSACNNQPWRFVVVRDKALQNRISERWASKAPVIVVAIGHHGESWKRGDGKDHCDVDIAIAVDHMTLMATELGLGTCWVCAFDAAACAAALDLPEHLEPIALLPTGYPAEKRDPDRHDTARKPLGDIVAWDGPPSS